MRDPNEALVFLARRESRLPGFHERFMLVAKLYAAGARYITIGLDEDQRFPSDGVTVHLPASSASVAAVERILNDEASLLAEPPKQRGNVVRLFWR